MKVLQRLSAPAPMIDIESACRCYSSLPLLREASLRRLPFLLEVGPKTVGIDSLGPQGPLGIDRLGTGDDVERALDPPPSLEGKAAESCSVCVRAVTGVTSVESNSVYYENVLHPGRISSK